MYFRFNFVWCILDKNHVAVHGKAILYHNFGWSECVAKVPGTINWNGFCARDVRLGFVSTSDHRRTPLLMFKFRLVGVRAPGGRLERTVFGMPNWARAPCSLRGLTGLTARKGLHRALEACDGHPHAGRSLRTVAACELGSRAVRAAWTEGPHDCLFRNLRVHRKRVTGIWAPGNRFEQASSSLRIGLARRPGCLGPWASRLTQTGLNRALEACDGHLGAGRSLRTFVVGMPNWARKPCALRGLTGPKAGGDGPIQCTGRV